MNKTDQDVLLSEDDSRYVMFPIKDQSIWKMYRTLFQNILLYMEWLTQTSYDTITFMDNVKCVSNNINRNEKLEIGWAVDI